VGIVSAIPYLSETELRDSRKSTDLKAGRAKKLLGTQNSSTTNYFFTRLPLLGLFPKRD